MNLNVFGTLAAVLRTGSLARAAAEMNLTASAVSMQMKQLESFIGQPLFNRAGRQIKATALAHELSRIMSAPLQQIGTLRQRSNVVIEGVIQIGVIDTLQGNLLPGLIRFQRLQHPGLVIRPVRGRSVELVDAVKAGVVDAAVVIEPARGGSSRLHWTRLTELNLVALAPIESKATRLAELVASYGWVRFDPNTTSGRLASACMHAHVPAARSSIELQSFIATVGMVSAGLGVTICMVPDPRILRAYPVRVLPLKKTKKIRISMVCRSADAESRQLQALRQGIDTVLEQEVRATVANSHRMP